jgi:hypothetical protein
MKVRKKQTSNTQGILTMKANKQKKTLPPSEPSSSELQEDNMSTRLLCQMSLSGLRESHQPLINSSESEWFTLGGPEPMRFPTDW